MNPMQEKVALLNNIAGKGATTDWTAIGRQLQLVQSEVAEASESIGKQDFEGLRDDIADILVTTLGLAHLIGVDAEADFNAVMEALFTRFDLSLEDAVKTSWKYSNIGIETSVHTHETDEATYHVTLSAIDQVDANGESYPAGKFLKSHKHRKEILPPVPEGCPFKSQTTPKEEAV